MPSDPNSPDVLVSLPTEVQAAILVGALEVHGIEAQAIGGFTSSFKAEAPGWVNVIVRSVDLERAKAALATIRQEQSEIDWSQVDFGQPE